MCKQAHRTDRINQDRIPCIVKGLPALSSYFIGTKTTQLCLSVRSQCSANQLSYCDVLERADNAEELREKTCKWTAEILALECN